VLNSVRCTPTLRRYFVERSGRNNCAACDASFVDFLDRSFAHGTITGTNLLPPPRLSQSFCTRRMTVTRFRCISMPAGFRRHLVGKTLRNVSATLSSLKYAFSVG